MHSQVVYYFGKSVYRQFKPFWTKKWIFEKNYLVFLSEIHCMKSVQRRSCFLLRTFPHSDWIRWDTPYFPCLNWIPRNTYLVRMPENLDKKKHRIWTLFEQWFLQNLHLSNLDQLGIKKRPFFWGKVYCKNQDHSSRVIVKN